jgi:hypothetical protein
MTAEKKNSGKKPYETPKFQVYGDIRQITLGLNLTMGNDHAGGSSNKTS